MSGSTASARCRDARAEIRGSRGRAGRRSPGRTWVMADLAPRQFRKVIPAVIGLAAVKAPRGSRRGQDRSPARCALLRADAQLSRPHARGIPRSADPACRAGGGAAGAGEGRGHRAAGGRPGGGNQWGGGGFDGFVDTLICQVCAGDGLELGLCRGPSHSRPPARAHPPLGRGAAAPDSVAPHRRRARRESAAGARSLGRACRACRRSRARASPSAASRRFESFGVDHGR